MLEDKEKWYVFNLFRIVTRIIIKQKKIVQIIHMCCSNCISTVCDKQCFIDSWSII
jgi:hypothetical protein